MTKKTKVKGEEEDLEDLEDVESEDEADEVTRQIIAEAELEERLR